MSAEATHVGCASGDGGLLALFALDALEAPAQRAVAAHVSACPACAAAVHTLRATCLPLALAVPQQAPPAALRGRVLVAVRRGRLRVLLYQGALAASVLLAVVGAVAARGYAVRAGELEASVERARAEARSAERELERARHLANENLAAMTVLASADLARIDLAGQAGAPEASGRAHWSRAHGLIVTVTHLPPLPPGTVYQLWIVTAAAPVSAGLLTPGADGGAAGVFATDPGIPPPVAVAVTREPSGGVPAPTGAMYLAGQT